MNKNKGKLYLIPAYLGDADASKIAIPAYQLAQIKHLRFIIAENAKPARAAIKSYNFDTKLQEIDVMEMNKHAKINIAEYFQPIKEGNDIGLISDAGLPCIADPGNEFVKYAHQHFIEVIPLVGPSSIMLSLMASGFDGQHFSFRGYIPIKDPDRTKFLKNCEYDAEYATQIFIETPYRNIPLIAQLEKNLHPKTQIVVACNLLQPDEKIYKGNAKKIAELTQGNIDKKPCIFLIGK